MHVYFATSKASNELANATNSREDSVVPVTISLYTVLNVLYCCSCQWSYINHFALLSLLNTSFPSLFELFLLILFPQSFQSSSL